MGPTETHHRLFGGMDRRPNAAWVSSPVVWPGWIALGRVGFITGCLAGMDRRPSPHRENWAAWVSPQAVKSRPLSGIAPALRAGHRNSDARQRRTSASSDWLLSICERGKSPPFTFPPITPAARSARRRLNADLWKALWRWMAARGRGQAHNLGLTGGRRAGGRRAGGRRAGGRRGGGRRYSRPHRESWPTPRPAGPRNPHRCRQSDQTTRIPAPPALPVVMPDSAQDRIESRLSGRSGPT